MNKITKIVLNLAIFFVIIGFAWYITVSINKDHSQSFGIDQRTTDSLSVHYKQIFSFKISEEIHRFDLCGNRLFISAGKQVYIFDTNGKQLANFSVEQNVRDITVDNDEIYLLYPIRIAVYSMNGQFVRQWDACSELSDYCSFTISGDAIFVTDAQNKDICKYTTDGNFVRFLKSPQGFIIPNYSFDIDSWNDTIYCVNSGRHSIETYTPDGDFITAFGTAGSEAGCFSGCCNPVYISFTPCGKLITSEKGNLRVSCFERDGQFKGIWLNSNMLGGNKACQVKAINDQLFVAMKNKIVIFQRCTASTSTCSACPASCPIKK